MKTLFICLMAMLVSISTFAQKSKGNSNRNLKPYLTYTCTLHSEYTSDKESKCPVCMNLMTLSKKEQMKAEVVKLYTCPMHPDVLCTKEGKCPACNMDMVEFKPKKKTKQG